MQADPALIDKLAFYLWFAEYAYEAGTEPNLKKVLASRGKPSECCLSASNMFRRLLLVLVCALSCPLGPKYRTSMRLLFHVADVS